MKEGRMNLYKVVNTDLMINDKYYKEGEEILLAEEVASKIPFLELVMGEEEGTFKEQKEAEEKKVKGKTK